MSSLQSPKRIPRDMTPDWPVDVDRVVRAHRLRTSVHSATRVVWLLAEALRSLGYEVNAITAPVSLSQHELRVELKASDPPPAARVRQVDVSVLTWGNRIWGLDTAQSWEEVLENGHAYLVDSVWDTRRNYLFRTIFHPGVSPTKGPEKERNYQPLIADIANTMKAVGLRPGRPLAAPLMPTLVPSLDYLQVREWIEKQEVNRPGVVEDIFEVYAGHQRTRAIWTREDIPHSPLPMGIFHWPTPAIQAFMQSCELEARLCVPVGVVSVPRSRM